MRKVVRLFCLSVGVAVLCFFSRMSIDVNASDLVLTPCKWNGSPSFVDSRDQHSYVQTRVGGHCWMAENLRFGKEVEDMRQDDDRILETSCYQNKSESCRRLGGLYTWNEAMAGVCPPGWRLPTDADWTALEHSFDSTITLDAEGWRGKDLAQKLVTLFGARFAGIAVSGWFFYEGRGAYFWTATSYSSAAAWSRGITRETEKVYRGPSDKQAGASVRCVRNP